MEATVGLTDSDTETPLEATDDELGLISVDEEDEAETLE